MLMQRMVTAAAPTGRARIRRYTPDADPVFAGVQRELPLFDDGGIEEIRLTGRPGESERAAYAERLGTDPALPEDAFLLDCDGRTATVAASNLRGRLYGLYYILQQAQAEGGYVPTGLVYSAPNCPFRGLKVYMPAPDDLGSFYDTVDLLCYYRYNTLILEVGGAMEYKRHPEINAAWIEYCREMNRYPERADEVQHMFPWDKNSIHFENGGGRWLTQDTVKTLLDYCRARGLDVIPEVPCLSHADYLLMPHPELAERADDPFPDVYCPSNPASYELLFDVLDEVVGVFRPRVVHIGHDEYYSIGICPRCRGRDAAEIYAGDIQKIHGYLKERGIRTMLWAEKLLNAIDRHGDCHGGSALWKRRADGRLELARPATYRAMELVPGDLIAHHWYYALRENYDREYLDRGLELVYGNYCAYFFPNWQSRLAAGARGGSPSNWSSLEPDTLQRNNVYLSLVYGVAQFWSADCGDDRYEELLTLCFEELYRYKYRKLLKKPHFEIVHGTTVQRPYQFISSVPLQNEKDTIGQYAVTWEDGSQCRIPIVYGLNIAHKDRTWTRRFRDPAVCRDAEADAYEVDTTLLSLSYSTLPLRRGEDTFFQMLAENPYPDKTIRSVALEKKEDVGPGDIILQSFAAKPPETV